MLSTLVPAVAALSFSDMPNDYSTVALQAAIDNGLLNGSDGKILPNDYLTRAQMATIIVRAFGATNEASLAGFSDVTGEEWYAPYLAKAVYMKVLQGDGTRLMPTDPITRQQVFTILARALKLEDGTLADLAAFSDASSVAPWAVGPTAALVKAGFIHGSDGKLNPTANILRKDFAVVMHNIFKKYITQPGTYTELPEGCVLINVPGVTLKNVTVKGDLVIGDGVGDGDVVLENVTITGRMVVRGGGLSSIIIRGSSSVGTVIVSKVDGNVRVFVEGDADVEVVYIDDGKDDVIVEGEVDKLVVSASDVPVTIKGTVDEVTVSGAKATITVDGEVGTLTTTSSATNTAVIVNDGANVEKVNANAAGTSVSGDGSVGSVNAAANNVNVSTVGTNVTAAPGVSGVKAGDKEVKPGETAKVEQGTTPGTGGGGGFPGGGGIVYAAEIDGKKYATLIEAFEAAESGDSIKLLADTQLEARVYIEKDVTLDLNGYTLSGPEGETHILMVRNQAKLTVLGTTENSTVIGAIGLVSDNAELNITGGRYVASVADDAVIYTNGLCKDMVITATGATFESTDDTFYLAGDGTYTLTDCVVNGYTGIYMKAGKLSMTGTTINATGPYADPVANGNGASSTGDGIILDAKKGYFGNMELELGEGNKITSQNAYAIRETYTDETKTATHKIIITGGEYDGSKGAISVSDYFRAAERVSFIAITGGTFNSDPSEFVADGYEANETDGKWVVSEATE